MTMVANMSPKCRLSALALLLIAGSSQSAAFRSRRGHSDYAASKEKTAEAYAPVVEKTQNVYWPPSTKTQNVYWPPSTQARRVEEGKARPAVSSKPLDKNTEQPAASSNAPEQNLKISSSLTRSRPVEEDRDQLAARSEPPQEKMAQPAAQNSWHLEQTQQPEDVRIEKLLESVWKEQEASPANAPVQQRNQHVYWPLAHEGSVKGGKERPAASATSPEHKWERQAAAFANLAEQQKSQKVQPLAYSAPVEEGRERPLTSSKAPEKKREQPPPPANAPEQRISPNVYWPSKHAVDQGSERSSASLSPLEQKREQPPPPANAPKTLSHWVLQQAVTGVYGLSYGAVSSMDWLLKKALREEAQPAAAQ
jgi:hypothetical protein